MNKLYLAGPMTGYEFHNFPAFDAAALDLRRSGYDVISPADIDRSLGYDGMTDLESPPLELLKLMFMKDLMAVMFEVDEVCLLPGWRKSKGACIEVSIACMLGKRCWEYVSGDDVVFHASTAASKAIQEIAIERKRQVEEEAYTALHDETVNSKGVLASAASCYALCSQFADNGDITKPSPPIHWPWSASSFKPSTRQRDLTKAGALIVAEKELG